ncbi:hypothetical protein P3T34_004546 [Kitasatospora sp. MAP12-44]|nr:hypothetical protein [Kitasatospora sp. MAP12-44]
MLGDPRGAVDALVAQREADHQVVGHLHGTDLGGVGEAGTAVDQHVVVALAHVAAQRVEELPAVEALVEQVPVQAAQRAGVVAVLAAGREQVDAAAGREAAPGERQRVAGHLGEVQVPARVVADLVQFLLVALGLGERVRVQLGLSQRLLAVVVDQGHHPWGGVQFGRVQEGVEELGEPGGLQVPVHGEHPEPVGGQDPGGVGQRHGAAGAALVGIEGDDPALAVLLDRRRGHGSG